MLSDCSPEVLNKNLPEATITSIASIYAHLVWSEDGIVHTLFQDKPLLYEAQGWGAKTGVTFPGFPPFIKPEWAKAVQMNLPSFQEYAKVVHAAVDAYLAGLPDSELGRKITSPVGEYSLEWFMVNVLGTHAPQHIGEIAALKGVQGLKGLPF